MTLKRMLALVTSVVGAAVILGPDVAHAQTRIPLVAFYSVARGDYFTTTQTDWVCTYFRNCSDGHTVPPDSGYVAVGLQGHVYDPASPQPAGTTPLTHWWSGARTDNFLTTNPIWAGTVGATRDGYFLFRIEGYIPTTFSAGTFPLRLFWNASAADNATLARSTPPAGYTLVRNEGYLLPPNGATTCGGTPSRQLPFFARANYVETFAFPDWLLSGDRFQFTGPSDWFTFDWWGHQYPVRGYYWSLAQGSNYPAPGLALRSLLARVTVGRVLSPSGWIEANTWFRALGEQTDLDGPCYYYDGTGVSGSAQVQTVFNDDNIGDNSGGANTVIKHWFY